MSRPAIPEVPAGTVLSFADGQWKFGAGELRFRVQRVRTDLARDYGWKWVWLEGEDLAGDTDQPAQRQVLVSTAALVRAVEAAVGGQHPSSTGGTP